MKKHYRLTILSLFILLTLVLGACAPQAVEAPPAAEPTAAEATAPTEDPTEAPTPEPAVITDSMGNEVVLPALPTRIVIAGKASPFTLATTYLFEEASQRVVAQELRGLTTPDFLSVIDAAFAHKDTLEMDAGPEQIAPFNPDLVIMKNWAVAKLGAALNEIDIPVVGIDMETPEKFYLDIVALGQVFGNPERAEEINAYYQERINSIEEKAANLSDEDKPTVLVLQYSEKDNAVAFKIPPATYLQTMIVNGSGGIPIWAEGSEAETDWIVVNFEQIATWNPDMIFIINYNQSSVETVEKLKADSKWQELKAVKEGQVYGFAGDFQSWELPAPSWLLGYLWIATKIQPELNADINMMDEVKSFYKTMYRLDDEQIDKSILSRLVMP